MLSFSPVCTTEFNCSARLELVTMLAVFTRLELLTRPVALTMPELVTRPVAATTELRPPLWTTVW